MAFRALFFLVFCFSLQSQASTSVELLPGVVGEIEQTFPKMLKDHEEVEDRYLLKVRIGQLSEENFEQLKAQFNNSSKVKFEPAKEYFLMDFLPPAAQALNGKALIHSYQEINLTFDPDKHGNLFPIFKNGVAINSNCWNTSIEFLLSMYNDSKSLSLYSQDAYGFHEYALKNGVEVTEKDLKPGDMIVVEEYDGHLLGDFFQHTAIYVAPNLVFERTAPLGHSPYRLAFMSDISKKFERIKVHFQGKLRYKYLEFEKDDLFNFDQDQLGKVYYEPIKEEHRKILAKHLPNINPDKLIMSCNPGLGGGCDPFVHEIQTVGLEYGSQGEAQLSTNSLDFVELK